jgi:hypothetical protein
VFLHCGPPRRSRSVFMFVSGFVDLPSDESSVGCFLRSCCRLACPCVPPNALLACAGEGLFQRDHVCPLHSTHG